MQKKNPAGTSRAPRRGSLPLVFGVMLLAGAAAIALIFRSPDDRAQTSAAVKLESPPAAPSPQQVPDAPASASSSTGSTGSTVPAASAWPADLPPLPLVQFPPPRPREVIQAVYQFAVRHPDVLNYVPCFCGCEHSGHASNTDCFVRSRESGGRIVWDEHGMT